MTTSTEQLTATRRTSELIDLMTAEPPADAVIDRIGVQRCGPVAIVTLSHPSALNALALESWQRLRSTFEQLAHDSELRAVIVRGSGARAFAAGADIKQFPDTRMTSRDAMHYNEFVSGTLRAVTALPVPVIAAVRGLAVGGGCELATACDIRLVADDARIGIPVGKLGVILGYTESRAASAVIGPAALKYLLFSGELLDAADAERIGFAQKVVAPDDLAAETVALVTSICNQSAVTIRAAKVIADMHGRALTAEDTELIHRLTVEAYEGDDLKEGVAAFTQGRRPVFGDGEGV
ncbi:enoyl-CoA hydratase [Rhodococcus sp. Leaf7]|uniref:enoyl-CoA hydratase/isomerase family protein n=1 Tax=unclassified Rhodococcus (in: high G+C Gram-positive bacteria) TaxID=192944 RepID=UPI0006F5B7DC|nr:MULTISPECIES: enoyl-CoA hydratase-related protein [unclassified Rhodococcus (in: high G+C Gram-positive bacteria)]KQU07126.1 enoyl-CoA hydratase [Rhodococcus sp. Leaf7]KQU42644.1 enoyl-CoA hydratase [Rhodococcus sp. Leaf247]